MTAPILCDYCESPAVLFLPSESPSERRFACERHAPWIRNEEVVMSTVLSGRSRFSELDYWQMFDRWEAHRLSIPSMVLAEPGPRNVVFRKGDLAQTPTVQHAHRDATYSSALTREIQPAPGTATQSLGANPRAAWKSNVLFATSIGLIIWIVRDPKPLEIATIVGILWPGIGLLALRPLRPTVRSNNTRDERIAQSFVFITFLPPVFLALQASQDWHLLSFNRGWLPTILGAIGFFALFRRQTNGWVSRATHPAVLIVVTIAVAYCVTIALNCVGDSSRPTRFNAIVIERVKVRRSRRTRYYLSVDPWGGNPQRNEIEVRRDLYDTKPSGSVLVIWERPGRLGIPWLRLE